MGTRPQPAGLHPLLLDPKYWRQRLESVGRVPRGLLLYPRPDLGHPGVEVLELHLRAHDGTRLRALLGRSAFRRDGTELRLRIVPPGQGEQLDWKVIESGVADLVFTASGPRRLEDRVLDVLRLLSSLATLDGVETDRIRLGLPESTPLADELLIAQRLREEQLC